MSIFDRKKKQGIPATPPQPSAPPAPERTSTLEAEPQSANSAQRKDFELKYEEDGVYIDIFSSIRVKGGADEVKRLIYKKKIDRLDEQLLAGLLSKGLCTHEKIAPPQEEKYYGEEIEIHVSNDRMSAEAVLIPGEPQGPKVTEKEIRERMGFANIRFGIDEEAVKGIAGSANYNAPITVALGAPPKNGEDGKLIWLFELKSVKKKAISDESTGKVNFKELDLFVPVKKEQALMRRTAPTEGVSGSDVTGKVLLAKNGKAVNFPRGKNTYVSSDGSELLASVNGMVDVVNDKVVVSDCYVVAGDVDMSVGNIDFDGSIAVKGNVITGMTLKATAGIVVNGVVEGAVLEAGGDITIRGGVQGAGKAHIQSDGIVFARFVEYATVMAAKKVEASYFVHSNVASGECVEVLSGKGCIIGGNVNAGMSVAAKVVGTPSNIITTIELGVSAIQSNRMAEIETRLAQINKDLERLELITKQSAASTSRDDERKKELRAKSLKAMLELNGQRKSLAAELQEIQTNLTSSERGQLHVLDKCYQNVKIIIGNTKLITDEIFGFSTFSLDEGEIAVKPCRYRTKG